MWEVRRVEYESSELARLLEDGWEPFSAAIGGQIANFHYVFLRKKTMPVTITPKDPPPSDY